MNHKAVVFDFGNVLGLFDHMKACKRLAVHSKIATAKDIYAFAIPSAINAERETGKMSPKEFFTRLSAEFNFDSSLSFEEFFGIWGDIFTPNKAIENIVQTLWQKLPIFVLSNSEEPHWQYIQQVPVMQKYFSKPEQQICSFRVGARKPDKKIFEEALNRSGLSSKEIVYIDDVPEYADAFWKMGGKVIHYDCRVDGIEMLNILL